MGVTLTITGQSTASRIKITNFAAPASGAVAILAKGNATISDVVADAQAVQWYSSGSGVEAIGILVTGQADVIVHGTKAKALADWLGDSRAIAAYGQGAHITIHNSILTARPAGFGVGLTAEGGGTAETHGCTIIGAGSSNTHAIAFEGASAEGSTLIVTDCGSEGSAVTGERPQEIAKSEATTISSTDGLRFGAGASPPRLWMERSSCLGGNLLRVS